MRQLRLGMCAIVLFGSASAAQDVATARTAVVRARVARVAPAPIAVRQQGDTNAGQMLATGLFAAAVGVVGGAYVGYMVDQQNCNDDYFCGLLGGIVGAAVGSTVMIPLGIHLVSRHSSFWAKLGVSALMGAGAAALLRPTSGISALALPPVQLITTLVLEDRATRRHNAMLGASHEH